jgi:threonine/homoserine/homoserine lactone efflux protein
MKSFTTILILVATLLAVPGPTNTLLWTSSALVGVRRTIPLLAAEAAGYISGVSVLSLIGRELFRENPRLQLAGILILSSYLVFLAWKLWHIKPALQASSAQPISFHHVFLTTLLNPKGAAFAFVIFPPFESVSAALRCVLVLIAVVPAIGVLWIVFGRSLQGPSRRRAAARIGSVGLLLAAVVTAASTA